MKIKALKRLCMFEKLLQCFTLCLFTCHKFHGGNQVIPQTNICSYILFSFLIFTQIKNLTWNQLKCGSENRHHQYPLCWGDAFDVSYSTVSQVISFDIKSLFRKSIMLTIVKMLICSHLFIHVSTTIKELQKIITCGLQLRKVNDDTCSLNSDPSCRGSSEVAVSDVNQARTMVNKFWWSSIVDPWWDKCR